MPMPSTAMPWDVRTLLGPAHLDPDAAGVALATLVDDALGRTIDPAGTSVSPIPYEIGSIATGALLRVHGRDLGGEPWSIFVKVLQHPRHWPLLPALPAPLAEEILREFPWRDEVGAWEPAFTGLLPDGMRTPALYRLADLGDDRLAVGMADGITAPEGGNPAPDARAP